MIAASLCDESSQAYSLNNFVLIHLVSEVIKLNKAGKDFSRPDYFVQIRFSMFSFDAWHVDGRSAS